MDGIQGGNFWSGFASGAISSVVSSAWGGGMMANGNVWKGLGGSWAGGDFGVIAFGTVSGGAGAALTGGNFWQGAATGLTVSLLNHYVHKMQATSNLRQKIINAGYKKPDEVANMTEAQIEIFAQKVFPEMYATAENPKIRLVESLGGGVGGTAGKTVTGTPGNLSVKSAGTITISKISLDSYMKLGSTIGHELMHMIDYVSGNYQSWANNNGLFGAHIQSEINAYGWEMSMNSPFFNGQEYWNNMNIRTLNNWKF